MSELHNNSKTEKKFVTSMALALFSGVIAIIFMLSLSLFSGGSGDIDFTESEPVEQLLPVTESKQPQTVTKKIITRDRTVTETKEEVPRRKTNADDEPNTIVSTDLKSKELADRLATAIELIDSGDAKEAQDILEQILEENPKNEEALVELAMIHLIDNRSATTALPYLEKALRINSGNKIALSELVGIYEELDMADQGLEFLSGIQGSDKDNGPLALGIGQMMVGQGRNSEAIPYLEAAAARDDQADFVLTDLADAYSTAGHPEKALATYKKAVEREMAKMAAASAADGGGDRGDERLGLLQMDYARELIRNGRYDEADELLGSVRQNLPDDESVSALQEHLNRKRAG